MWQLEIILLNDIYPFVIHKGAEFFFNNQYFIDHWNDIPMLQFWTLKLIFLNKNDLEKKYFVLLFIMSNFNFQF